VPSEVASQALTIGGRLKLARIAAAMSLRDVANALGISKQGVGHWELDRSEPTITNLGKVSQLYNVRLHWLITGEGKMQRPAVFVSHSSQDSQAAEQIVQAAQQFEVDRQNELLQTINTMLRAGLIIGRIMIVRDGSIMIESRDQGRRAKIGVENDNGA
jgi:transcriptional regulator with XRE-family HTH domain